MADGKNEPGRVFCNNEHIAIQWNHPGVCPLCACFKRIQSLEDAARTMIAAAYVGDGKMVCPTAFLEPIHGLARGLRGDLEVSHKILAKSDDED